MDSADTSTSNTQSKTLVLSSRHVGYLEKEAKISSDIQHAAGLFTSDKGLSRDFIGFEKSGIMFPYFDLNGEMIDCRLRLDDPTVGDDGKKTRYLQGKSASLSCYFLKRSIPNLLNPNIPLVIVEGEKKLLCIESNAKFESQHVIVSYPGCWNFKTKNESDLAETWRQIPLEGRRIFWIPDTDFFTNDFVYRAGETFTRLLIAKGATVELVDLRIPDYPNEKIGPDDFIIKYGIAAFLGRIDAPSWSFASDNILWGKTSDQIIKILKSRILTKFDDLESLLENVSKQTGTSLTMLRQLWRETQKEWKSLRHKQAATSKSYREVHIDGNIPRREIFEEIATVLRMDGRFYRYGHELLRVEEAKQDLIGPESLPAKLNDLGIEFVTENRKTCELKYQLLPGNHSQALFHSDSLRSQLDEIILFANHPVYDRNWELSKPGYNRDEKIFYQGLEIKPVRQARLVKEIIKDFLFRDEASRHNFVSILLSAILRNKYRGARPIGAFTGNKPQLGKTLAARLASIVAEGLPPQTITYTRNQEELEKQIAAKARTRDVLFIDNAKSNLPIESAVLERSITDDPLSFRLLGKSESITRPNTLIFMISMNDAQFCQDITRRALPISFFLEEDKDPSSIKFSHLSLEEFVKNNRIQILQELCGMVENWKDLGRPICDKDFRFREWAREVGGILVVNGFTAFLDNLETAYSEYDKTSHEIGRMFDGSIGKAMTADDLCKICDRDNLFADMLQNTKRAPTALSHLLAKYIGKRIPLPDHSFFVLREGRWNPSLKVKTFVAEQGGGRSTGTTGTTGDPVDQGTREVTSCNTKGNDNRPGTPGTETVFPEKTENADHPQKEAKLSHFATNPKTVPGVPGETPNHLDSQVDSFRGHDRGPTNAVPGHTPTSPEVGTASPNDLEWL